MCKYSFILPYYKRSIQFKNTLDSFISLYTDRKDFEIIVVEDYKNQCDDIWHNELLNLIKEYKDFFLIQHLLRPEELVYNPSRHHNMGAKAANGEYLILSNPECTHENNILRTFDEVLQINPQSYLICACINFDGTWYQHSIHNNKFYHWCSCISKKQFDYIGGFDEEYALGNAFEDDDFVKNINFHNIDIITLDECIVKHQEHEVLTGILPDFWTLWGRNHQYYISKWARIQAEENKSE